jgi:fructoselysine 6-phosphate deglycase
MFDIDLNRGNYPLPLDGKFFASVDTPKLITHILENHLRTIEDLAKEISANKLANLHFVGCACNFSAGHDAKYILDKYSKIACNFYTGYQFLSRSPYILDKNSYVFFMSLSGETPDVIKAKNFALPLGVKSVVISRTMETPLASDQPVANCVFDYKYLAGVYTGPLTILFLLCAYLAKYREGNDAFCQKIINDMHKVPDYMLQQSKKCAVEAEKWAERFDDINLYYVMGSGILYGLAFKIAKSVINENIWMDGVDIDTAEFYHGPIEVVEPILPEKANRAFIHLLCKEKNARIPSMQALNFLTSKNVTQIAFDAMDYPQFNELFDPYVLFAPTEWLCMHLAARRNHNVEDRRYMGKLSSQWGSYG